MADPQIPDNKNISPVNKEANLPIFARIAVFDNLRSIPRTVDINHETIKEFIDEVPGKVYSLSREQGGKIPYTIIKEVIENLIHADFKDISITILDNGNNIIISDQGPGIIDKDKAFLPGYTSATKSMRKYIRGVGSGLPIIKETITFSGGSVFIEDNIKRGTVVSLKIGDGVLNGISSTKFIVDNTYPAGLDDAKKLQQHPGAYNLKSDASFNVLSPGEVSPASKNQEGDFENFKLSIRQKKILSLVLELEETGPASIAKELGFSLSTSYRELVFLEDLKLLSLSDSGKRKLTDKGKKFLEYYSNNF